VVRYFKQEKYAICRPKKNDIAFRKFFGSATIHNENKKEILISFLNAVLKLEGNKKITWVEILNPYHLPIVLCVKSNRKAKATRLRELFCNSVRMFIFVFAVV
jgi:hypothetical protein